MKKINKIIKYIEKIVKKHHIQQIFFTRSMELTEHLKDIENCEININKYYEYIDVLNLTKNEEEIINKHFNLGILGEIRNEKEN